MNDDYKSRRAVAWASPWASRQGPLGEPARADAYSICCRLAASPWAGRRSLWPFPGLRPGRAGKGR